VFLVPEIRSVHVFADMICGVAAHRAKQRRHPAMGNLSTLSGHRADPMPVEPRHRTPYRADRKQHDEHGQQLALHHHPPGHWTQHFEIHAPNSS